MTEPELDPSYLGPDPELIERYSRATQSPSFIAMPAEEAAALQQRVIGTRLFTDLSAADQALIESGEAEVYAGASPTLQDPAEYGTYEQWASEDAAAEADDADVTGLPGKGFDFTDTDTEDGGDGLPPAAGDDWVGV